MSINQESRLSIRSFLLRFHCHPFIIQVMFCSLFLSPQWVSAEEPAKKPIDPPPVAEISLLLINPLYDDDKQAYIEGNFAAKSRDVEILPNPLPNPEAPRNTAKSNTQILQLTGDSPMYLHGVSDFSGTDPLDNTAWIAIESSAERTLWMINNDPAAGRVLNLGVEGAIAAEQGIHIKNGSSVYDLQVDGRSFFNQALVIGDTSSNTLGEVVIKNLKTVPIFTGALYRDASNNVKWWPSSACPRVDAWIDGRWQEVGRAIKFNDGLEKRGDHYINLAVPAKRFRLVEDEPERSYVTIQSEMGEPWSLGGEIETKPGDVFLFEFSQPVTKLKTTGHYEIITE